MAPPPLTAEERAARMDKLVTALPEEEWGQKESAAVPVAATAADELPPLDEMGSAAKTTKSGGAAEKQAVDARTSRLEAEHYDGASDSSDDGESSAGDPDDAMLDDDLEGDDEEDAPAIVGGEDGLDMGEEMDEFLKFATETLGLTEEQYQGILGERRQRGGAFLSSSSSSFLGYLRRRVSDVLATIRSLRSRTGRAEEDQRPAFENRLLLHLYRQTHSFLHRRRTAFARRCHRRRPAPSSDSAAPQPEPRRLRLADGEDGKGARLLPNHRLFVRQANRIDVNSERGRRALWRP